MSEDNKVIRLLEELLESSKDNTETGHEILKTQEIGYNKSLKVFVVVLFLIAEIFHFVNLRRCTEDTEDLKMELVRMEAKNDQLQRQNKEIINLLQEHKFDQ